MRKKIIALLLAVLTILSVSGAVSAQDSIEEQAAVIKMLNIMNGDPDGNFRLEDYVTRAEFSKVAIAASSYRNSVAAGMNISPFEDVPYTHWATPYIKLAVTNKIVSGYPDSTFRPDQTVTYEEALTIVLKLLGYTNEDFGSSWPYGQVGLAKNLSLTDGIDRQIGDPMTRGNVVTLFYNLLDTKMKGNTAKYITVLDCEIVESVILIATT